MDVRVPEQISEKILELCQKIAPAAPTPEFTNMVHSSATPENYASAIVTTDEVVDSISSLSKPLGLSAQSNSIDWR
jgi:hypothetical protein